MEYKIEKNIPMPNKRSAKYPWHDMEVGDSFLITDAGRTKAGYFVNYSHWASKKNAPKKFAQRTEGQALRVWRIK